MPTKYCPHCGDRTGFRVEFNITCQFGQTSEACYLRTCQSCGGRFLTLQKDERVKIDNGESIIQGGKEKWV